MTCFSVIYFPPSSCRLSLRTRHDNSPAGFFERSNTLLLAVPSSRRRDSRPVAQSWASTCIGGGCSTTCWEHPSGLDLIYTHTLSTSMASLAPSTTAAAAPGSRLQVLGASSSPSGPARPKFNSHVTSDRLREGAGLYLPSLFRTPGSNIRKGRVSVFKELGLDDLTVSRVPVDDK